MILGWSALIKGILILAFPRWMQKSSEPFLTDRALKFLPYGTLLLGLWFGYLGLRP
jgi:hypothetical protein